MVFGDAVSQLPFGNVLQVLINGELECRAGRCGTIDTAEERMLPGVGRHQHFAVLATDLKSHQRRTIVQIDTGPVPPLRVRIKIFRRPFVIEPGAAFYG